jgi:DNA-binding response OmpR family regulator
MKLLIAEDDLTSRAILEAVLTKWGYDVTSVDDGDKAFAALQAVGAPQLAVLDWEMPGLDGAALCRKLRGQERKLPLYLILLTSRGDSGNMVEGFAAGADDYIAKPYDAAELQARISAGRRMIALQNEMREREKLEGVLEMAGAVCHELNQPLQSVSGFSELLLMDMTPDDPQRETLTMIKEGIDRIGELTRKIMKITRYQSKPYLSSTIVDIEQACQQTEGGNSHE